MFSIEPIIWVLGIITVIAVVIVATATILIVSLVRNYQSTASNPYKF
ncbi:hypothetical protein HD598_000195 [Neomicrococcus aestuarii]|uniref:Uncharacterized protein n=1 Tax=Neomicrococcus aestuarii TaxID=556325 RepID=A0A7W8TRN0_9MICC|nr:hypothetical protein [Neomicrococcus aestuarii]MBB5511508.1 hypothetical protein [Neomicrococcus aestuarii]